MWGWDGWMVEIGYHRYSKSTFDANRNVMKLQFKSSDMSGRGDHLKTLPGVLSSLTKTWLSTISGDLELCKSHVHFLFKFHTAKLPVIVIVLKTSN